MCLFMCAFLVDVDYCSYLKVSSSLAHTPCAFVTMMLSFVQAVVFNCLAQLCTMHLLSLIEARK